MVAAGEAAAGEVAAGEVGNFNRDTRVSSYRVHYIYIYDGERLGGGGNIISRIVCGGVRERSGTCGTRVRGGPDDPRPAATAFQLVATSSRSPCPLASRADPVASLRAVRVRASFITGAGEKNRWALTKTHGPCVQQLIVIDCSGIEKEKNRLKLIIRRHLERAVDEWRCDLHEDMRQTI